MKINHDAQVKIFLVMPYMDGMSDIDGGRPDFKFPDLKHCEVHLSKECAEMALLKKQKENTDSTYIIMESIAFAAKHDHIDEYFMVDTKKW